MPATPNRTKNASTLPIRYNIPAEYDCYVMVGRFVEKTAEKAGKKTLR